MSESSPASRLASLEARVLAHIRAEAASVVPTESFDALAQDVFTWQYEACLPYQRYCLSRGKTPARFTHWLEAPPVPTDVFKALELRTFGEEEICRTFLTSGTTVGSRGRHVFRSLELYDEALLPTFCRSMLPDLERLPFFSLIPDAQEVPESSLSYMVSSLMERVAAPGSRVYFSGGALHLSQLEVDLKTTCLTGQPILLLSTGFALFHALERLPPFALPRGSRLMVTGGMKGQGEEPTPDALRAHVEARLGIGPAYCLQEYGMTELSSQLYEGTLRDSRLMGVLCPPPWLKVAVVDPLNLQPVQDGEPGLVRFFDLANVGSIAAVQTSDIGVKDGEGVRLSGRSPGATPRGCSLTAREILTGRALSDD